MNCNRQLTEFEDKFGDGMTAMGDKIKEELIENLKIALGLINEINNGVVLQHIHQQHLLEAVVLQPRSTDGNSNKVGGCKKLSTK